jgi:hypothetical protein
MLVSLIATSNSRCRDMLLIRQRSTHLLSTVCPEQQLSVSSPEARNNLGLPAEASKLQTKNDFK